MVIKYPYLPEGKHILYVSDGNPFMQEAKHACNGLSTESKQPTGAVLVRDGKIIARAANESRIKNVSLLKLHNRLCMRKLLHVPTGTHYWVCPGCAAYRQHAESRVVRAARNDGIKTDGADLYLYGHWWCCKPCWDAMISAGIRDIYLLDGSDKLFNRGSSENWTGENR